MQRRKFISSVLGATALGAVGAQLYYRLPGKGGSGRAAPLAKLTRTGRALGTDLSLTVFHADPSIGHQAIDDAFAAIDHIEDVMSLYRPQSQLCQLNETGRIDNPDPALVEVLQRAAELSAQSDGAFDVTVQPLWASYSDATMNNQLPSAANIASLLPLIDWRMVSVSAEAITFQQPGMAITLNGIAQGLAADAAAQALRQHGIAHALIDSGEIGAIGSHAQKDHWAIGLKDPRHPQSLLGIAALDNRSLATSGDYESTFADDFSAHHLIDPRTGRSPTYLSSVSVVAPTALEADALSTALFLMGEKRGRELICALSGVDALFVDKAGHRSSTKAFPIT